MKCKKSLIINILAIPTLTIIGYAASIILPTNAACAVPQIPGTVQGEPFFMEGKGVRNCGKARAEEDAKQACIRKAREAGREYNTTGIENFEQDTWKTWDGKRKCKYRATVTCIFDKDK